MRTTPDRITELRPGEIFVFGSNLAGMHGGGAARLASLKFGAVWGQGVGLQGESYAIPTMQGGVETIRPYVDEFIGFARQHPRMTFLVTEIGCGIAGFTPAEIAPLFEAARRVENHHLPGAVLGRTRPVIRCVPAGGARGAARASRTHFRGRFAGFSRINSYLSTE